MPRRLYAFEDLESPFEDHVINIGAKPIGRASSETGSPAPGPAQPQKKNADRSSDHRDLPFTKIEQCLEAITIDTSPAKVLQR
jgi:hypothetical protein